MGCGILLSSSSRIQLNIKAISSVFVFICRHQDRRTHCLGDLLSHVRRAVAAFCYLHHQVWIHSIFRVDPVKYFCCLRSITSIFKGTWFSWVSWRRPKINNYLYLFGQILLNSHFETGGLIALEASFHTFDGQRIVDWNSDNLLHGGK